MCVRACACTCMCVSVYHYHTEIFNTVSHVSDPNTVLPDSVLPEDPEREKDNGLGGDFSPSPEDKLLPGAGEPGNTGEITTLTPLEPDGIQLNLTEQIEPKEYRTHEKCGVRVMDREREGRERRRERSMDREKVREISGSSC